MPPKPPAPKKGGAAPAQASFPLPRPKPVTIEPVDPMKLPSSLAASRTFLFASRTEATVEKPAEAAAALSVEPALTPATGKGAAAAAAAADAAAAAPPPPQVPKITRTQHVRFHALKGTPSEQIELAPATVAQGADGSQVRVFGDSAEVCAVAAGSNHLVVATPNGLFGAGSNSDGQLGCASSGDHDFGTQVRQIAVPRMPPADAATRAAAKKALSADEAAIAEQHARVSAGLARPPMIVDLAAGEKHTVVVVLRTQTDAYLDRPGDRSFVPFTQVLACGYARRGALGLPGTCSNAAASVRAGPVSVARLSPVAVLDDAVIDRVWAHRDLSFARGAAGLYGWGTFPRRVLIPKPLLLCAEPDIRSVAVSDDAVFVVCSGGTRVLRWTPALAGGSGEQVLDAPLSASDWEDISATLLQRRHTESGTVVVSVCCGSSHAVALLSNGEVLGFGHNGFGQIGATTPADGSANSLMAPRPDLDIAAQLERERAERERAEAARKQTPTPPVETAKAPAKGLANRTGSMRKGSTVEAAKQMAASSRPPSAASTASAAPEVVATPVCAIGIACCANSTVIQLSNGQLKTFGRPCFTPPAATS